MKKIGVIGVGIMGTGLAKNLLKKGYEVLALTRHDIAGLKNEEKMAELMNLGAAFTNDLHEVFTTTEVIVCCLPRAEDNESVLIDGLCRDEQACVKYVIDFSTSKPGSTRKIAAALKEKGIAMLDTPTSGGSKAADEGTLKLMIGGDAKDVEDVKPILESVSIQMVHIGDNGAGHIMKLINNLLAQQNMCTTAACYLLCEKNGINPEKLYEFINQSGGNSVGFQIQYKTIANGTYPLTFALDYGIKDLAYTNECLEASGIDYSVVKAVKDEFAAASEAGYGSQDIGTIYKFMNDKFGR